MKITVGKKIGDLKVVADGNRDILEACHKHMIDITGFKMNMRAGDLPTCQIDAIFRGVEFELPKECVGMNIVCHHPTPADSAALDRIAEIIERVDHRAQFGAVVTPTLVEMQQSEMQEIYDLAKRLERARPRGSRYGGGGGGRPSGTGRGGGSD